VLNLVKLLDANSSLNPRRVLSVFHVCWRRGAAGAITGRRCDRELIPDVQYDSKPFRANRLPRLLSNLGACCWSYGA